MKSRTRARSLALQALFEIDIANHPPAEVLSNRLEGELLTDELAEFVRQIIFGILPITRDLDDIIAEYAPEWPLEQMAAIDRNILRLACWEMAVQRETPIKVAINEAVELAKVFGSDSAPRFVNGVLGSLADHQHEIEQQLKHAMLASPAKAAVADSEVK
jgi:N utilization substance protein B